MNPAVRRFAYRHLEPLASWTLQDRPEFAVYLERANIAQRPEMYVAVRYLGMAIVAAVTLIGMGVLLLLGAGPLALSATLTLGLLVEGVIYAWTFLIPEVKAFMRGERLDDNLPYAVNYMAAVARADITPEEVFKNLARQPLYGEVTVEAQRICRDFDTLGMDLVAALQRASLRSPTDRFKDFLQGTITSVSAGGSFQGYLEVKAEQYMDHLQQEQEAFLENLALLAESYVTVVVAGPMFVIVLLTVLVLFGSSGGSPLELGYVFMLLLVPLAHLGFMVTIETISPSV